MLLISSLLIESIIENDQEIMLSKFVKDYHLVQGFLLSLLLSQFALGIRIQQVHDEDISDLIGSQILVLLMAFSIWVNNQFLIKNIKISFPGFRILIGLLSSILISTILYYISPFDYFPLLYLKPTFLQTVFASLIIRAVVLFTVMYPIQYYLFRDKKLETERLSIEQQKQEALHLRLAFLGKQLDPHFLFNSLSVLRAGTKDQWVKNYVNKLTQVYRYSLQKDHNDGLALVMDELEFVQSYLSLFQERFEDALIVEVNVEEMEKDAYLPRLALQLLVENALKHNQFTLKNPIRIEIYNEGKDVLVVRNNLQLHAHSDYKKEPSGIGLKNLKQRYKLLKRKEIIILLDDQYYTVKIPIIKNS